MIYTDEKTLEIRISKEPDQDLFGCDLVNLDGELVLGLTPEFATKEAALFYALTDKAAGLCNAEDTDHSIFDGFSSYNLRGMHPRRGVSPYRPQGAHHDNL